MKVVHHLWSFHYYKCTSSGVEHRLPEFCRASLQINFKCTAIARSAVTRSPSSSLSSGGRDTFHGPLQQRIMSRVRVFVRDGSSSTSFLPTNTTHHVDYKIPEFFWRMIKRIKRNPWKTATVWAYSVFRLWLYHVCKPSAHGTAFSVLNINFKPPVRS